MSHSAIEWAVAQPLDNPAAKLVLLILAHHMNHKTGRCFPSVATIARESGLSDRGVRLAIARLAKLGLIETHGSTTRRHYRLDVTAAAARADVARETPASGAEAATDTPAAPAATPARAAGHSGTPCRLTGKEPGMNREGENAPPPQVNAVGMNEKTLGKPEQVARRRATLLAAEWRPSAEGIAFAERRHPHVDWQREARAFRDYWLAKPDGLSADWEASWRRWLDRATQFATRREPQTDRTQREWAPSEEPWHMRVRVLVEKETWLNEWGPRPGQDGCRVPADVLRRFGYPVYERGQLVPPVAPATGAGTS